MKIRPNIYVYQVYLDKRFADEAELIRILEPYAKKRRASSIIARALISYFLGKRTEQASVDIEPQISADDIQAIDDNDESEGGGDGLLDKFTGMFKMG